MKYSNKNYTKKYEKLMQLCFKSALKAKGKNMPNPYVGAVVFDEDTDNIISIGYHKEYGKNHADIYFGNGY